MIVRTVLVCGILGLAACGTRPPATPVAAEPKATPAPSGPALSSEVDPAGSRAAGLQVVEAKFTVVSSELEAPGQLTWDEDRTWSIGVVATGKVITVAAKVGDPVRKGDILAKMHSHDVHDTKALLRQARTERQRALSQVELAKRNQGRMQRLLELKAVPQLQSEQADAEVRNAEAAVKHAQADVDRETQHLTEVLEISAEEEDESRPEAPHSEADDPELVPIKSSADGIVIERKISAGSVVTVGENAFHVSDPESLWLIASFPERALPRLKVGQPVTIRVQAYPGRLFQGRIMRLGDTMDKETRTLKVRIAVNAQKSLKPEMYASVILNGAADRALTVPAGAIQEIDGHTTVFVETKPGSFEPRKVVAEVSGGLAIIREGLREGERVASQGSYFLKGRIVQASEGAAP